MFHTKEKQRDEHTRFLASLVDDVTSPLQIGPVVNLLRTLDLSKEQLETLVYALSSRLEKISGDDRSFSSSAFAIDDETSRLLHSCDEKGISGTLLIRALRSYYVRHFSADRCSDTLRDANDNGALPGIVNRFNKRVRELPDDNIGEIEADEVKPSRIQGKASVDFYWTSTRSQKLMETFKNLKFGSSRKPLTASDIDTAEWKGDFDQFLKQLQSWDKDDEASVEDYFHQKCNLYEGVRSLPLSKQRREEVLREFISFLWRFDLKSLKRIEWWWHARTLLPPSMKDLSQLNQERRELLEASNNAVLFEYADVSKVLSQTGEKAGAGAELRKP